MTRAIAKRSRKLQSQADAAPEFEAEEDENENNACSWDAKEQCQVKMDALRRGIEAARE